MDQTPSNGSGVRARSRKANTSPTPAPSDTNRQPPEGRQSMAPQRSASGRSRSRLDQCRHTRSALCRPSRAIQPLPSKTFSQSSTAAIGPSSAWWATSSRCRPTSSKKVTTCCSPAPVYRTETERRVAGNPDAIGRERSLGGPVHRRAEHPLRLQRAGLHGRLRLVAGRLSKTAGRGAGPLVRAARRRATRRRGGRALHRRGRSRASAGVCRAVAIARRPRRATRGSRTRDFGRAGRDHGPLARSQRRHALSARTAA